MVDRTTVDVHAMTKVRMYVLVLVQGYSGHVQNGIFGIILALHEILVLTSHIFDLNFDFWSFHCLVVFGNTGWIRGLVLGYTVMVWRVVVLWWGCFSIL